MSGLTPETFVKWKTDILKSLQSATYDQSLFSPLFDIISDLKNGGAVREPLTSFIEEIMCNLIPTAINFILNTLSPSASIDTSYFKLLQQICTLLPHFIDSSFNEYIDAISSVVTQQKSHFYSQSFSDFFGVSSSFSPHYQSLIKTMATALFMQKAQAYIQQDEPISFAANPELSASHTISGSLYASSGFHSSNSLSNLATSSFDNLQYEEPQFSFYRTYQIFVFISAFQKYLDKLAIKDFLNTIFPKIEQAIRQFTPKEIRKIKEKEVNSLFKHFQSLCSDTNLNNAMIKLQIRFNIDLIQSGLLSKQFSGLRHIKDQIIDNNKTIKKLVYSGLKKANVIDYLFDHIHHELVKNFIILIREMLKDNFLEPNHIKQLWTTALKQHQSTIDIFFNSLSNIAMSMSTNQTTILFEAIIETASFPDASIVFLGKDVLKLSPKQKNSLFTKLSEIYFRNNLSVNTKNLLLLIISKFIPVEKENRTELQQKCFQHLKKQENLDYSLAILKKSLVDLNESDARQYLDTILNLPSLNNIQFLDLIHNLIRCIPDSLSEETFNKLIEMAKESLLPKYQIELNKFWADIINEKKLSSNSILILFKRVANPELVSNENVLSFIHFLFLKMNSKNATDISNHTSIQLNDWTAMKTLNKCKGLDEIWSVLYRAPNLKLIDSLVHLYLHSKQRDKTDNFIEHCNGHLRSHGILKALSAYIHEAEDGINKDLLNIYPNRFLSDYDYNNINMSGECEMSIRVPKYISANSLMSEISYLLDKSRNSIIFTKNEQLFTPNDKIEDNMTITIKFQKSSQSRPPPVNASTLPSIILFKSPICKELYEIMISNEVTVSQLAYEVLSLLPSIKDEMKLAKSKKTDWDSFLNFETPFLFLYRSNIIGNLIISRRSDWFDSFVATQGASKFIKMVLKLSSRISTLNLLKLMRIIELIFDQARFENVASQFFSDFPPESSNQLMAILSSTEDPDLVSVCLKFLAQVVPYQIDGISQNEKLTLIVKKTIFHKNTKIRISIRDIILQLPFTTQSSLFTYLLPVSTTSNYCDDFFIIVTEIAKITEDVTGTWNKLVDIFFKRFVCPNSENPIARLEFETPAPSFVTGIITALIELTKRFDTISNESDLFWFIIDQILFNGYNYYELTPQYFTLLDIILKQDPSLVDQFVTKINSLKFPSSKTSASFKLLPYKRYKGLKNLGCTCYMNSVLQQFFHLSDFRNLLLSANINSTRRKNRKKDKNTDNADISCESSFELNNAQNITDDCVTNSSCEISDSSIGLQTKSSTKIQNEDNRWVFELQKLFAQLLYFPSAYIDPINYVRNWKDWDNLPVNPRKQQDAVEYLQMVLDRIEDQIPNSSNLFKGEIVHSVVGISQEYTTETVEEFATFSVEVKDHTCINDSLVSFLAPDRFDGQNQYIVEGIGKIDAERFSRVRKAPKLLIVQLKRFEYNLQTSIREKINDVYKFDTELDFSSVMENPGEFVKYNLCGVTIHMGKASGGHYISHILTDYGWFTFNDDNVHPIGVSEMLKMSYGGFDLVDKYDEGKGIYITTKVPKNLNAYLLFYRRVQTTVRDESSLFDFSAIPRDLNTIDSPVLLSLLKDINEVLLKNVMTSDAFHSFLLSNTFKSDQFTYRFWYNSFILYVRNHCSRHHLTEVCDKIKENKDRNLPDFLMQQEDHIIEILLQTEVKETRELYLSLFDQFALQSSFESQERLVTFLLNQISQEGDFLMNYYSNFDHFFQLLKIFISRETENWPTILLNFLFTNVLKHTEKKKALSEILIDIDLSAVFSMLTVIFEKRNLNQKYASQVTTPEFILSFTLSNTHCKPFIDFILPFNISVPTIIQNQIKTIAASSMTSLFVISLFMKTDTGAITQYVQKQNEEFLTNFFKALTDRALAFKLDQFDIMEHLKPLLSNLFNSREKSLRMAILEFIEASQINIRKIYNFLINQMSNIISTTDLISYDVMRDNIHSKEVSEYLPTHEYFLLLKRVVVLGSYQSDIIQNGKQFVEAVKKLSHMIFYPNYPIMDLMDFLVDSLGEHNYESFFKVASFSTFISSMNIINSTNDYSFIRHLLSFIPMSKNASFFKTGVFTNLAMIMFSHTADTGMLLMNELLNRSKEDSNAQLIANVLWSNDVFNRNLALGAHYYFKTSWKLIKRKPFLVGGIINGKKIPSSFSSNIFEGCLNNVSNALVSTTTTNNNTNGTNLAPYCAKLLSAYSTHFVQLNTGRKSLFKGNLVEHLTKKFKHLNYNRMLFLARHEPKYCLFLMTIAELNEKIASILFDLIKNENDGFLKKVSTKTIKNASKLISKLCSIKIRNNSSHGSIVSSVILRELVFTSNSKSVEPLCNALKLVEGKKSGLVPIVCKIVDETKDPFIFNGSFENILLDIGRFDNSLITVFSEKAVAMLQKLIDEETNNENMVKVLLSFLEELKQSFDSAFQKVTFDAEKSNAKYFKIIQISPQENAYQAIERLGLL